jgi:hypothetical protein
VDAEQQTYGAELRLTYRYMKEHPWVVGAVNGFLSAYFMEQPGFQVRRHFDELESGMHVWLCEVPRTMKMGTLLRRLRADIPPCTCTETVADAALSVRCVIDNLQPDATRSAAT